MRILLADDNREVRSALRLLLEEADGRRPARPDASDCEIAETSDAAGTLAELTRQPADVVLLDWELPGLPPGELLSKIKLLTPGCAVMAMSGRPEARKHSLALGADGFVSKNEPPDRLLELLNIARSGLPGHLADLGD